MPTVSLQASLDGFVAQTQALQNLLPALPGLAPPHRKLVAEIMLIRLCLALENSVESACAKLLCGAQYLDSSAPMTLVSAASVKGALRLISSYGRGAKPLTQLSWTQTKLIRKNMKMTLSPSDPLFGCLASHATFLAELRGVRNHIAHKNSVTASEFRKLVKQRYGALRRGMTPGLFLLHNLTPPHPKIEEYLISTRVFMRSIVRA